MSPCWKKWWAAVIVAVVVMASTFSSAAAEEFDVSLYTRNASLSNDLDLFWIIDSDRETIRVAVHAKRASGWAGIGISEMGGMEGADIVYYEAMTGNITDTYSIIAGTPMTDDCTQDWTFISAEVGTNGLVFEAERALDTGDSQDRVFADDSAEGTSPSTLIAAWGNSETISYHGNNFALGQVILFGGVENSNTDPLNGITSSSSVSFFDATTKNFTIPTDRTWYEDTCVSASELPALDEYHAIGFEAIVQNSTSKYIHHLVLTAYTGSDDCGRSCEEWSDNSYYTTSSNSSSTISYVTSEDGSEIPSFCVFEFASIFLWAPGIADEQLPDDIGFRFGSTSGGYTSLELQTHYNNVDGDEGMVDSSGVRIYYTDELRPIDMGVLSLGDPNVDLLGVPVPEGKSSVLFECPGSCTENNFKEENVTIYAHVLHMHENGQRVITRQYRKNDSGSEVLVHKAEAEYYSFLQSGGYVVKVNDSMLIKKGDRFETECFYDTSLSSVSSDSVEFGLGSEDEMCIGFIFYYPNQAISNSGACGYKACGGSMKEYLALDDDSDFSRTFGTSTVCAEDGNLQDEEDQKSSSISIMPGLVNFGFVAAATLVVASK